MLSRRLDSSHGKSTVGEPCTYLCGNSLGPLSKRSEAHIKEELEVWATRCVLAILSEFFFVDIDIYCSAVEAHFNHPHERPWAPIADLACPSLAKLVGAEPKEVACMGTLTANLHLMMTSFYNPTGERFKIICEAKAFPSDRASSRFCWLHAYVINMYSVYVVCFPVPGGTPWLRPC